MPISILAVRLRDDDIVLIFRSDADIPLYLMWLIWQDSVYYRINTEYSYTLTAYHTSHIIWTDYRYPVM